MDRKNGNTESPSRCQHRPGVFGAQSQQRDRAGIENPAISFGAIDIATQIKVGYGVSGSVKDVNFNAGVLLGWDFIWEHPFDEVTTSETDSNGNETTTEHDTINYDRFENLTHYGFFVSITY